MGGISTTHFRAGKTEGWEGALQPSSIHPSPGGVSPYPLGLCFSTCTAGKWVCSTSVCPGTSGPTWAPPLLSAPQLLGPGSSEGQACCWGGARTQSHWLRLPLFGFSELLRLMKGFVLPRQGGFFTGSLLSVGAWTETGLHAQGLVSGQRERRGELRLPSDRRGGLLPSNRGSQREGQGTRHRMPSPLGAQSRRAEAHPEGRPPGQLPLSAPQLSVQ